MKSIELKNFRKFENMERITLGGVNMFVGGNNAGKSTVVKAMLLVADFLKNSKVTSDRVFERPRFYFDGYDGHSVNIDLFYRALYRNCPEEDKSITFNVVIGSFKIEICVFDVTDDDTIPYGDIKYIKLEDIDKNIKFDFQLDAATMSVSFGYEESENNYHELIGKREQIESNICTIKSQIDSLSEAPGDNSNLTGLLTELSDLNKKLTELDSLAKDISSKNGVYTIPLNQSCSTMINYISSLILGFVDFADRKSKSDTKEERQLKNELMSAAHDLKTIAANLEFTLQSINFEYLSAHSAEQHVHYGKKDGNDYVARSIHEFNKLRINEDSLEGKLLVQWLQKFNCADSYKIVSPDGESYWFYLILNGKRVHLGDMGRGTIQLVVLFIRLATIIRKYKGRIVKPIVLVEEPEQNLHPKVQSDLADLFYDIYRNYGIRFLVETHSEYMIWQVQIEMANYFKENDIENAPVRVFYFPSSGKPYDMGYQKNGKFVKSMEPGFFNIQSKAAIKLLEMED